MLSTNFSYPGYKLPPLNRPNRRAGPTREFTQLPFRYQPKVEQLLDVGLEDPGDVQVLYIVAADLRARIVRVWA